MNLFGGKKPEVYFNNNPLILAISLIILFFIKVFIVQWSYNMIFPKLSANMSRTTTFKPLTLTESMIVVILFTSLF